MRSILGECSGNVRSTPTPNDCLRTVKVSRAPEPWRLMTIPSNTWVRLRVPSTTWKCTRTRSPAWKTGTRRGWARSMLSMTPDIEEARPAGWPVARARMVATRGRRLAAPPRPLAALLQPPLAHLAVVARQQDLRHGVAVPVVRPRVVRVLRGALERVAERLLDRAVLVPERPRQLAQHGVRHGHRRQLASRQHVVADRDDVGCQLLVHALVEALVAPAQQRQLGAARELSGQSVVEAATARRERDHAPAAPVGPVARQQRGLHDVQPHHHARPATVRG